MTRIGATGSRVIPALEGPGGLGGQDSSPAVIGSVCDILDVDCTYLADGDVLQWNGYAWVAGPVATATALDDLTDVTITSPAALNMLIYDGTSQWINTAALWRPLMDGAGVVITDAGTGEAIMAFA